MNTKEAIERIKTRFDKWALDDEDMKAIQTLIPELVESDDERIRKLLVWQVYRNIEDETNDLAQSVYDGIKGHDPDIEESIEDWKKCLAYLEKQKEQKPAEYLDNDKVYAIMTKLTNLSYSQLIPINSDEFKKIHEITSDVRDLLDYPIEQKQEWSYEDEKMIDDIIRALTKMAESEDNILPEILPSVARKYVERLKSLRPQYHGDVTMTEAYKMGKEAGEASHWKPSEEHLSALLAVFNDPNNIGSQTCQLALTDLYEQLKKL